MARDPAEMQRYFRECMAPCRELLTPPSFPPLDPAPRMDADDVAAAVAKAVAEALASRSAKEKPVEVEAPESPKEARPAQTDERPKWVIAAEGIKKIKQAGEAYTSERDLAKRVGVSQRSVQTAFTKSEDLQAWRQGTKQERLPMATSLNEVHLASVTATNESPPIEEELDEGAVQLALEEICKAAKPAERERISTLGEDERRQLAGIYLSREWGVDRDERPDYIGNRRL